jgi:hypothetical protein
MAEYPRGDAYRVPLTDKERHQLAEAWHNDIVNILENKIMLKPDDARRAAREIRELREEAEKLRKLLRNGDGHNLISRAIVEITYLRQHQHNLPY